MKQSVMLDLATHCVKINVWRNKHYLIHYQKVVYIGHIKKSHDPLYTTAATKTRSSAIAEGPRDASCQLKSCQLPNNSAETTYTTSPDQIDGMKLEI